MGGEFPTFANNCQPIEKETTIGKEEKQALVSEMSGVG